MHSSSPKMHSLEAEHVTALQKKVQNNGAFFPAIFETFSSELQLWVRNKLFSISTLCRWHRSQNILTSCFCCRCLFSKLFLCVFYTALQSPSIQLVVLSHAKTLILLWNPHKHQWAASLGTVSWSCKSCKNTTDVCEGWISPPISKLLPAWALSLGEN